MGLAKGTRGDLDPRGLEGFRVTGGFGAPLPELLEILQANTLVAGEVQQRIEEHAAVAGREHEAIPVEPLGIAGVVAQHLVPEGIGHRRRAHRQAGVAGIGLVDRIDRQEADAVDAEGVDGQGVHCGGGDHGEERWGGEGFLEGSGTEVQLILRKARQTL